MIKFLPLSKHLLTLLFCLFMGWSASAQSKIDKGSKESSKSKESGLNSNAIPVAKSEGEKTSKIPTEGYRYLVFFNPTDQLAKEVWTALPALYSDLRIEPMNGANNLFLLMTYNPEMALFKRAYGAYFQIFNHDDLLFYGGSMPCLAEIRPMFEQVAKKISTK